MIIIVITIIHIIKRGAKIRMAIMKMIVIIARLNDYNTIRHLDNLSFAEAVTNVG